MHILVFSRGKGTRNLEFFNPPAVVRESKRNIFCNSTFFSEFNFPNKILKPPNYTMYKDLKFTF